MNNKIKDLSTDIANYLNNVNYNYFTQIEIAEAIQEYTAMFNQNDTQQFVDVLNNEYSNTNDIKVLDLITRVKDIQITSLATEINDYMKEVDPYGYNDIVGEYELFATEAENIENIILQIKQVNDYNNQGLIDTFTTDMFESDDIKEIQQCKSILKNIKRLSKY